MHHCCGITFACLQCKHVPMMTSRSRAAVHQIQTLQYKYKDMSAGFFLPPHRPPCRLSPRHVHRVHTSLTWLDIPHIKTAFLTSWRSCCQAERIADGSFQQRLASVCTSHTEVRGSLQGLRATRWIRPDDRGSTVCWLPGETFLLFTPKKKKKTKRKNINYGILHVPERRGCADEESPEPRREWTVADRLGALVCGGALLRLCALHTRPRCRFPCCIQARTLSSDIRDSGLKKRERVAVKKYVKIGRKSKEIKVIKCIVRKQQNMNLKNYVYALWRQLKHPIGCYGDIIQFPAYETLWKSNCQNNVYWRFN